MKIYLAGPDVFHPTARARAEAARELLAQLGHVALLPLDNEATSATGIYRANLELIAAADVVIADLNPFRGCEPDSGTAFEVGYAVALGKRVIAYLGDPRAQADKLAERFGRRRRGDGRLADPEGLAIEDFGLPVNLMLGCACEFAGGDLAAALRLI